MMAQLHFFRGRNGLALVTLLFVTVILQGCISLKCADCDQCNTSGGGPQAPCYKHHPSPAEQQLTGCAADGYLCNAPNKSCSSAAKANGTCTNVNNAGACDCNCM